MSKTDINLFELPIPQLQAVGQQLEQEIQILTSSFGQLKQAQVKFRDGIESLKRLDSTTSEDVLVPLTNSLYVSGKLRGKECVIVDVGTGYYIEKVSTMPFYPM